MIVRWLCERETCESGWVDGVRLLSVWCVEWRWCVLLLSAQCVQPGPRLARPSAVLISTALCRALSVVGCVLLCG